MQTVDQKRNLIRWEIAGILATAVIVLSIPLYSLMERRELAVPQLVGRPAPPVFVGSMECRDCHREAFDKWQDSHHRQAMAVADEDSVRGDFNNAVFEHFGVTSRFYRKEGRYFVHTRGPGGEMGDFEITHTFGWTPLQQYLVPFDNGRYQCLPIAWDVQKGRWYHLYPDRRISPDDWLYWTNQGQNWNGMCAECHSTDLKKNFDMEKDAYHTTWSEISVGCEACHGPGSEHVRWAKLPEMGRPAMASYGLAVSTAGMTAVQQIQLCAPCHSRRMSLEDNIHRHDDFLDYGIPQLLSEGMYHPDGQILEEVYVYGSFMQSKMYTRGIRCSDCHDVHSARRHLEGNALCLSCHQAARYDTRNHHFHKKEGETGEPIRSTTGEILFGVGSGASCEQCHMPGRTYMGVDYRPDHGFRIPQPELTQTTGSPNACNRCHIDKNVEWSAKSMQKWYGEKQRDHYGTALAAGRDRLPEALPDLASLAGDRLYPAIVRATALSLLSVYPDVTAGTAIRQALTDEEALLRHTAVQHLNEGDPEKRLTLLAPLLHDPVKGVRMEAARQLASIPRAEMQQETREAYEQAMAAYRRAMGRTADFATSRHNLANLSEALGQPAAAEQHYRAAITIDGGFWPSKVNLAMLLNRQKKNPAAETLLREVVRDHPDRYEVHYSLGLLLAEMQQFESAAIHLATAAGGLPRRARIQYNLGLLLQRLNRDTEAETALVRALAADPDNGEFQYALALFYLQRQKLDKAHALAVKMVKTPLTKTAGEQLLQAIERRRQ